MDRDVFCLICHPLPVVYPQGRPSRASQPSSGWGGRCLCPEPWIQEGEKFPFSILLPRGVSPIARLRAIPLGAALCPGAALGCLTDGQTDGKQPGEGRECQKLPAAEKVMGRAAWLGGGRAHHVPPRQGDGEENSSPAVTHWLGKEPARALSQLGTAL